jgi:hypothetical protein
MTRILSRIGNKLFPDKWHDTISYKQPEQIFTMQEYFGALLVKEPNCLGNSYVIGKRVSGFPQLLNLIYQKTSEDSYLCFVNGAIEGGKLKKYLQKQALRIFMLKTFYCIIPGNWPEYHSEGFFKRYPVYILRAGHSIISKLIDLTMDIVPMLVANRFYVMDSAAKLLLLWRNPGQFNPVIRKDFYFNLYGYSHA